MESWAFVFPSSELAEGQRRIAKVGERLAAFVRVEGTVYAIDDTCPHRGGSMGQGDLQGFHLYCPLHAWSFDVRTGVGFFPKGARIACFTVRELEGRVEALVTSQG